MCRYLDAPITVCLEAASDEAEAGLLAMLMRSPARWRCTRKVHG